VTEEKEERTFEMLTLTKKKRVSRVVQGLSVAVLLFAFIGTANAVEGQLPDDSKCLTCHRIKALKKTLDSGEKLSLHVSRDEFAQSVHNVIGCAGCHGIIDLTEHKQKRSISSAHDYSVEQVQVCRNCHAGKFELYDPSAARHARNATKTFLMPMHKASTDRHLKRRVTCRCRYAPTATSRMTLQRLPPGTG
jgi:nitrate/TMAO reductase-like tetraheme cytochrome c subunit